MNRRKVLCAAVVAFLPALALAGVDTISPPEVIPTISPDDLNGISLSPDGLSGVAVGNNGAIIQFDGQNVRGGVVASGTTKDLYDVDVVSKNLAFISGRESSSGSTHARPMFGLPNDMHPRQIRDTSRPVRPRRAYFILALLAFSPTLSDARLSVATAH